MAILLGLIGKGDLGSKESDPVDWIIDNMHNPNLQPEP
jgi:hypothetical protein